MSKKRSNIEEARQVLRDAGLRATPARIAVINHLSATARPVSHHEVSEQLESGGIDKSTIFRALQDLAQAGLARRMELGDHVWRYERAKPGTPEEQSAQPHPHLLCVDCGSITCLSDDEVNLTVSKSVGTIEDVLLKGHCLNCNTEE